MPSHPSPTLAPSPETDPRLEPGAYITDGEDLYRVISLRAGVMVVEDCMTNTMLRLDLVRMMTKCSLVRQAENP